MSNKNLFKEAIADAKAVREAALANAKAALEEALTPKLQSMLAAKLQEMDLNEDEEIDEAKKSEDEKMEEGMYPDVTGDTIQDKYRATGAALEESDELEEDFDLSEILAELNEAEEEKEEEEETEEEEVEGEEEVEVKDMTIEDLKDLIKDIVSQEIEAETPSMDMGAEEESEEVVDMGGEEMAAGAEDEIDLAELLAELDSLDESDELEEAKKKEDKEDKKEKKKMVKEADEAKEKEIKLTLNEYTGDPAAYELGQWVISNFPAVADALKGAATEGGQEIVDLGLKVIGLATAGAIAIPASLALAKDSIVKAAKKVKAAMFGGMKEAEGVDPELAAIVAKIKKNENQDDLSEAIDTINTLRNELNEVNLLNAKLLYVNKIFKAKNLTESQKVKVIASFDKATNVQEAKVVFESLQSALTAAPKTQIKENLGFASKAAGVAPNKVIVESNDVISRMQKLANIK